MFSFKLNVRLQYKQKNILIGICMNNDNIYFLNHRHPPLNYWKPLYSNGYRIPNFK